MKWLFTHYKLTMLIYTKTYDNDNYVLLIIIIQSISNLDRGKLQ